MGSVKSEFKPQILPDNELVTFRPQTGNDPPILCGTKLLVRLFAYLYCPPLNNKKQNNT